MMSEIHKRFWLVIIIIIITLVGCTSQPEMENPPLETADPAENSQKASSTPQAEQRTTEPVAVEIELTTTAVPTTTTVPSATPVIAPEATMAQEGTEANADVLFVKARQESEESWHFTVTVEHPDTGWEDYADGWDVVLPDGSVAKPDQDSPFTRLLLHPHETEQPFTRSQGGVLIAPGTTEVTVRAHDLVDGFGGREVVLNLLSNSGPDYEIQRLSK